MMLRSLHDRRYADHHSRILHDLSALVLNLLRSPSHHDSLSSSVSSSAAMTAAGFASLMLGLSFALMLCGSLTFFVGFMLMPWVLGLVLFLYVAGIVSALSFLGSSILRFAIRPHHSPKHHIDIPFFLPGWKLL